MSKLFWTITACVLFVFLVLFFLFYNSNFIAKIDCQLSEGSWDRTSVGEACDYPPHDYGKLCYQDTDCERRCLYGSSDKDGYLTGRCSKGILVCNEKTIPKKTKLITDLNDNRCLR